MQNLRQYILETRGCYLPVTEDDSACSSFCSDTMNAYNWGENVKTLNIEKDLVVVRFKNNRKEVFHNHEKLFLKKGDIVAVEAVSGHDVGIVDLTDATAYWYALKNGVLKQDVILKIYRKARQTDIDKWKLSIERERPTLLKTKKIIEDLGLDMKLGDVEYQGDGSKATFYYTADERVDFRELIKILAQEFKIRVEMRQIGARQESARIGGIGPCGMELCCIRWKKSFESVTTASARFQELSLNPTKLAGQCGKLKCCLNYELDAYIEARKLFPDTSIVLHTKQGDAFFQKSDVFKQILWYSFDPDNSVNITSLTIDRVNEIIEMNKQNEVPDTLLQNKLDLSDLISSKHNVQVSEDEIIRSKSNLGKDNTNNKNRKKRNKLHSKQKSVSQSNKNSGQKRSQSKNQQQKLTNQKKKNILNKKRQNNKNKNSKK